MRMLSAAAAFLQGTERLSGREVHAALVLFDQAEERGYDPNACAGKRWQCRMLLGDFEGAWRESDKILARDAPDDHRLWDGRPFEGNRVIIRCLHGYGDAIQFLRYAPLIRKSASRVMVETHPEMVSLLTHVSGVDRVTTWGAGDDLKDDGWDQQIEVMELPRAFRTSLTTIPATVPYIRIGLTDSSALPKQTPFRIGLVWASSAWNPLRSLRLSELAPLFDLDDFSFYSFQHGPQRAELAGCAFGSSIHDTAHHSSEILDSAIGLLNIDLLITVDTMAAHLAGALGLRVWTLLPFEADWRWMVDTDRTPWYPTMELFRQPYPASGWAPVVKRLCDRLKLLSQG